MEIVGNILLICVAILLVIITLVVIISFVETLYVKLNARKIQERKLQELGTNIQEFANMINEFNEMCSCEKKNTKKTTKKKDTK